MEIYDVAVVGGGAAGCMAAIRAGQLKKKTILVERNDAIGKKILITGNGRCNITNLSPIEIFVEKFQKVGLFLRPAFYSFSNTDLMDFFKAKGLELKVEDGKVFPATDKASSVIEVLEKYLSENNVKLVYGFRLADIKKEDGCFKLIVEKGDDVSAKRVILATGGVSYKKTGSEGDGFRIAQNLGHAVLPLRLGLVPLRAKEAWIKELQGLAPGDAQIFIKQNKLKAVSDIGELIFTHFGISGPLVLDISAKIISMLEHKKNIEIFIDMKPALSIEELDEKILGEFKAKGRSQLKNALRGLLPNRLIPVIMRLAGIDPGKEVNQMTQKERRTVINLINALPLTITGTLSIEEAMVTDGGVSEKEIDPKTLESKIVPGLYFAGEIIEGSGPSGGYNLQQAFSTGYLAGEGAANA